MTDDTSERQPAWPLSADVPGLDENGRLTEEAVAAIANAATDYAIAIRDGEGFPDHMAQLAVVVRDGFHAYWMSVRQALWTSVSEDVFQRDWVDEGIGLGPNAYSRSTEEAKRVWDQAFVRVWPRRDEPA